MNTIYVENEITKFDTGAIGVAYPPLEFAHENWAYATTDPTSARREDLLHARGKR